MSILTQTKRGRGRLAVSLALTFLLNPGLGTLLAAPPPRPPKTPNILFFIMDDVGVDQMKSFGYGGATTPRTPNMDAIAHAGVRFRNTWSMPECTPSRAIFFEGRYPLRTNIYNVVTSFVLANSQVSPFETTTPKVLKTKGYESGLFGKFHLAGTENNPFGSGVVHALGWDYFAGFLEGAPFPVDTTAGGVGPIVNSTTQQGPYSCGFVPNATDDPTYGADTGACYFADSRSCTELSRSLTRPAPGRTCLEQGGIFVPNQSCQAAPPSNVDFSKPNAYYVSKLVINKDDGSVEQVPITDPQARVYRSTLESDLAIQWIRQRKATTPWMATVSYSSIHAPYQQPPTSLLPLASVDANGFDCTELGPTRVLSNQMLESMDHEIGRVMVEAGLATYNANGSINYDPAATDTMVVIVGDNGTYLPSVKLPFDPNHSKGTVYQTGVWVPLIVSGPLVNTPDRDVNAMVNIADIYQLFGEIAGIDVRKVVPKSHVLDSVSMLPYLINPNQPPLRQTNFTQTGPSLVSTLPSPCVLNFEGLNICFQIFPAQGVCEAEGGTWYGNAATCCDVQKQDPSVTLLADKAQATRNDRFKLVRLELTNCTTNVDDTQYEFYEINESTPLPKIDHPDGNFANNLLTSPTLPPQGLTPEQLTNFNALYAELQTVLNSEVACAGDGNLDKKVNGHDIHNWRVFSAIPVDSETGLNSSWYDLNLDGKTDATDRAIIQQNLGTNCLKQK